MTKIIPQRKNANRHTPRGMGMLEASIQQDGIIGAMTVAADGETFDGSARGEVLPAVGFDLNDVSQVVKAEPGRALIIESDGSSPLVHRRTDIPSADDPRARRLGVAANRIAQVNLSWEPDVLAELNGAVDLSGMFFPHELANLAQPDSEPVDPDGLWEGMPEFENEDKTAYKSLTLHFKDQDAVDAFAELVGQTITDKTRYLWYPKIEIETYADKRYAPES